MTSVGGTSLESDNPGMNPSPPYPANGVETVWNVDNLCNTSADEGGEPGLFWCGVDGPGAGGGGSSQFWGRPFYQAGPGVNNPFSTTGNGTTQCSFAATGTPCREVPDISANADEWTPYAEYCTGNAHTPGSSCGQFSGSFNPPGWFGIGGTSLSSPLWSAIIADRDSYQGARSGNINPLLYLLLNLDPGRYFHDITGIGPNQAAATNNGLFPTTPGYDEATGIGTPKMAPLITGTSEPSAKRPCGRPGPRGGRTAAVGAARAVPDLQRRLRQHRRRPAAPAGAVRRGDPAHPAGARTAARRGNGHRAAGADAADRGAAGGQDRAGRRAGCSARTARRSTATSGPRTAR